MGTNGMVGTLRCDVPARKAGGIRSAAVSAASSGGVSPPVPETETRTETVLALAGGTPALPAHFLPIGNAKWKRTEIGGFAGEFKDFRETRIQQGASANYANWREGSLCVAADVNRP